MITKSTSPIVMKYYNIYEGQAAIYARQVFDSYKIGMDYEDLVQEFKLKIFTSIIAYANKWAQYKKTGRYKPVPLELYVKSALNNRKKDFYKAINDAPYSISVEETGFDYSESNSIFSRIVPKEGIAELNGIDLVCGLNKMESKCFIMFIYGFPLARLQKIFRGSIEDVEGLVTSKISELKKHYSTLSENSLTVYKTYCLEEQQ